jgi:NAD dependent epimerase/dehydratase
MNLAGKKVLVTGAGGFIGSHLAGRLVELGCRVIALTHYDSRPGRGNLEFLESRILDELDVRPGDIRDPWFMLDVTKGCQAVFHLAALIGIPYSYVAPASYVETNVQGTMNVLKAGQAAGVERLVHTSTSECYGTARYTPIDEAHPLCAQSPYSATKIGADKLAESFFLTYKLPVSVIRPFNTFGPRQSARAIVPTILSQLVSGAAKLRLGSLDPVRDMNYVENIVDGFLAIAASDKTVGQVINVGSGTGVTIGELAGLAMKIVGRDVPIERDESRARPDASEVRMLVCDYARAKDLAGWSPAVDLKNGLERTAAFIKTHPELYRPEEYAR